MPNYPPIHENGIAYLVVEIVNTTRKRNGESLFIEPLVIVEKAGVLSLERGFCKEGLYLLPKSTYAKFMANLKYPPSGIPEWEYITPNSTTGTVSLNHAIDRAKKFVQRIQKEQGKPEITAEIRPEQLPQYALGAPPPSEFHGKVYLVARNIALTDVIKNQDPHVADLSIFIGTEK